MTGFQPRAAVALDHSVGTATERDGATARATVIPTAKAVAYRRAHRLTVLVVDPRSLTREGLTKLLENQDSIRVLAVASADDAAALREDEIADVGVVLLNIGYAGVGDQAVQHDLEALSSVTAARPVIIVSERNDSQHVGEALQLGARGYIPTTSTAQLLVGALFLVQAGGTFVPAEAFAKALSERRPEVPERGIARTDETLGGLTPRQLDVLSLLRQGKPNKIIAFELSMRESTVKVHVRAIMRKLKASNRTEVVFRASNMGTAARG